MSVETLPDIGPAEERATIPSYREQLAAQRAEMERERFIELEVPGYRDLWARYRVLSYPEVRRIGSKNQHYKDEAEGERAVAADTLVTACVGLLRRHPNGSFEELGVRWTPNAAAEMFGVNLPEGAGSRDALLALFPGAAGSMNLMYHFREYDAELAHLGPADDEAIMGESAASSTTA